MTTTRPCEVPGCASACSGYSPLCAKHKTHKARHGHPRQDPVTVHELRPFMRQVEARQKRNPNGEAWTILDQRWQGLVAHCRKVVESYEAGAVSHVYTVHASRQVLAVAGAVPSAKVFQAYAAMYMLQHEQPHRFRSDRSFDFQLARRVRGLTTAHAGTYWNQRLQKSSRVYRTVPPKTAEALAALLKNTFGSAGLQLANLPKTEEAREAARQKQLSEAIQALA